MQTPRGALAPEFRSSGRPTKWGDRQQHRSDWDDSPAAVRALPGTLRKLLVSLATPGPGRALLAGWLGAVGLLFRRERVFWGYGGRRGGPEVAWGGYGQKARAGFSPSSPTPRESTPRQGQQLY